MLGIKPYLPPHREKKAWTLSFLSIYLQTSLPSFLPLSSSVRGKVTLPDFSYSLGLWPEYHCFLILGIYCIGYSSFPFSPIPTVPWIQHVHSHLRAFALTLSSAWDTLPLKCARLTPSLPPSLTTSTGLPWPHSLCTCTALLPPHSSSPWLRCSSLPHNAS